MTIVHSAKKRHQNQQESMNQSQLGLDLRQLLPTREITAH